MADRFMVSRERDGREEMSVYRRRCSVTLWVWDSTVSLLVVSCSLESAQPQSRFYVSLQVLSSLVVLLWILAM